MWQYDFNVEDHGDTIALIPLTEKGLSLAMKYFAGYPCACPKPDHDYEDHNIGDPIYITKRWCHINSGWCAMDQINALQTVGYRLPPNAWDLSAPWKEWGLVAEDTK